MERFHQLMARIASSPDLEPDTQLRLAISGQQAKSPSGDRILIALAARKDLSDRARSVVEASTRAAVRARWLSRDDHPDGYVRASVDGEKRVTVLAAIAEQPSISEELVRMLAHSGSPLVASALLRRDDLGKEEVRACVAALAGGPKLTYRQENEVRTAITSRPEQWPDFAKDARTAGHLKFLADTRGFQFPEGDLPRLTAALTAGWEQEASQRRVGARWSNSKIVNALGTLVSQQSWVPGSEEDRTVSSIAKALHDAGKDLGKGPLLGCLLRHHGTAQEQADYMEAAMLRVAVIEQASSTDDEDLLVAFAKSGDSGLHEALRRNPHLRPRHLLLGMRSVETAMRMRHLPGGEGELAAAIALAGDHQCFAQLCSEHDEETLGRIVRQAVDMRRKWNGSYAWHWRAYCRNEKLAAKIVPALRIHEIADIVEDPYVDDTVRELMTTAVAEMVRQGLADDSCWQVFTSMAGEMDECSLEQAVQIARTV